MFKSTPTQRTKRGFTMIELLVTISLVAVLVALLLPALFAGRSAGDRLNSMNNLRQSGLWIQMYSQENRSFVLPSSFDYSGSPLPVKVRSNMSNVGLPQYVGTWTDIIWTLYAETSFPPAAFDLPGGHDYTTDSPDDALFEYLPDIEVPTRSAALNTKGNRAVPGYFAANNFFTVDPTDPDFTNWYTHAQISRPERSLYIIDSWAGETISPQPDPFNYGNGTGPHEVDFRYQGEALILFLDNHIEGQSIFGDIDELEQSRRVKVRDLHRPW